MERILSNGMKVYASYPYGELTSVQRKYAEKIKDEYADYSYFEEVARTMSKYIPHNAILVAIPDHDGWNGANRLLCACIQSYLPGTVEICALQSPQRASVRQLKRHNGEVKPEDLMMYKISNHVGNDDSPVVLIDNVIDTGVTMIAAQQALGCECIGVAYAMTREYNNNKTNSTMTGNRAVMDGHARYVCSKFDKQICDLTEEETLEVAKQLLKDFNEVVLNGVTYTNESINNKNKEKTMEKNNVKKVVKDGKTVLVCGNCGAELQGLAEHEHVACGKVIGKDSGLGTIVMPAVNNSNNNKNENNMEQNNGTMNNGGFDMTAMMQMMTQMMTMMSQNPQMKDAMVETIKQTFGMNAPAQSAPTATKATEQQVAEVMERKEKMMKMANTWLEKGYHNHIQRQMFEDFGVRLEYDAQGKAVCVDNFTKHLNELGYDYSWKTMCHTLEVMNTIQKKDPDEYEIMYRCFIAEDAPLRMAEGWLEQLKKWIENKCDVANGKRKDAYGCEVKRGKYYKTQIFSNFDKDFAKGVFVDEFEERVLNKFRNAINKIKNALSENTYFEAFFEFNKLRRSVKFTTKVDINFKEAFKMWGSWCVIDIMMAYDEVKMFVGMDKGKDVQRGAMLTTSESYKMVREMLWRKDEDGEYHYKGFMFFGLMKELIERNEFDYNKKKAEYKTINN